LVAVCSDHHALIHGKLTAEQRQNITITENEAFRRTYR
jgi:hypothetical protein